MLILSIEPVTEEDWPNDSGAPVKRIVHVIGRKIVFHSLDSTNVCTLQATFTSRRWPERRACACLARAARRGTTATIEPLSWCSPRPHRACLSCASCPTRSTPASVSASVLLTSVFSAPTSFHVLIPLRCTELTSIDLLLIN